MRNQLALDWLIERVELVDGDGNAIDRAKLDAPTQDEGSTEDAE